jgi:putative sterol carrier protein
VLSDHVDPAFAKAGGSYRFDVLGAGSWRLDVREGTLVVSESTERADLVVELSEEVLLGMFRGEQNPSTAFLTGSVKLAGDLALAPRLERFMPEPHGV